jgi:hypothetical protein
MEIKEAERMLMSAPLYSINVRLFINHYFFSLQQIVLHSCPVVSPVVEQQQSHNVSSQIPSTSLAYVLIPKQDRTGSKISFTHDCAMRGPKHIKAPNEREILEQLGVVDWLVPIGVTSLFMLQRDTAYSAAIINTVFFIMHP